MRRALGRLIWWLVEPHVDRRIVDALRLREEMRRERTNPGGIVILPPGVTPQQAHELAGSWGDRG